MNLLAPLRCQEIEIFKIKQFIAKEIKKSELSIELKNRLLISLNLTKNPNNKILKKKIDVNEFNDIAIYNRETKKWKAVK